MNRDAYSVEPPPSSSNDETIAAIHEDVLRAHIMTRLDGPTLASAACASSRFHALSSQLELWTNICRSRWPSVDLPRLRQVISKFPDGPRSFFADSYSLPAGVAIASSGHPRLDLYCPSELVSAVDIRYRGKLIFSRVVDTDTESGWFQCSPFRIDVLDPKDAVRTEIEFTDAERACRDLDEGLRLSWILVDPNGRRAMDLSSHAPVSAQRHWLTGELQVSFATVLEVGKGNGEGEGEREMVQCGVVVTCGGWEGEGVGGLLHVREVSLQVEDVEGMFLSGKESLGILQRALVGRRRRGRRDMEEEKERERERYEEFARRKRDSKEKKLRKEGTLDVLFVGFGVLAFAVFCWGLIFSRR